jgi:hypothetical protein
MQILVANPSYQLVRFEYRVPEHARSFRAAIYPGSQVRLAPGDFSEAQKDSVVEQLERYGAVPDSEVRGIKIVVPGTSPVRRTLVFSIQTPIKSDKIDEAREADETIRQAISDREAEAAGCATIPPNIQPEVARVLRQTQQESTLHIEQIQSLETERGQKGGVNKTITVSKKAGKRERRVG